MRIVRTAIVSLMIDSDFAGGSEGTVAVVLVHHDPFPQAVEVSNVLVFGPRRARVSAGHTHLPDEASVGDEDHIYRGEN